MQSGPAGEVLQKYYQQQRRAAQRAESRTTIRMLESLVRLAQAHARLCNRAMVEVADAVAVVDAMECSISSTDAEAGHDGVGESNALAASFWYRIPVCSDPTQVMIRTLCSEIFTQTQTQITSGSAGEF